MLKTLRWRLSVSYILITMLCVILISLLSNILLDQLFKKYVIQQQEKENRSIVMDINEQYAIYGKWNYDVITNIGLNAIDKGIFITVKDLSGNIVWDASAYNYSKCEIVKKHLTDNMIAHYPNWEAMYEKHQYDVISSLQKVGSIQIGYYGPFYYTDNDIVYLNTLNKILLSVGLAALLISLSLGIIMARRLSKPILSVVNTAEMISKGNYSQSVKKNTNIEELEKLITTINNLGYALNQQENLRMRLTRDVSHELRTPLTTLHSHMEAMIDGVWEPSIDRLNSCQEEIVRLKRLVGDLENLAKYESEGLTLNKTYFSLNDTIKNIVFNFQPEFLNKGVKLVFLEKNLKLTADRDKISQVLVNLISNSLKYTLVGGEVEIRINKDKGFVIIEVKDTGIGIDEKHIPYIFERFYRVDESRNKTTGGAGIGLTITKSIIEAHGGTITAVSELNKGTRFYVKIPN